MTHNEQSVVYTLLPESTPTHRLIQVRERDAAAFKLEYPDFVRMPWRVVKSKVRDNPVGGALVVKPPRLAIGNTSVGKLKKERRVNDQKLLTVLGRAALSRAGSAHWRPGGTAAGRDTVVWELEFRCLGTARAGLLHTPAGIAAAALIRLRACWMPRSQLAAASAQPAAVTTRRVRVTRFSNVHAYPESGYV